MPNWTPKQALSGLMSKFRQSDSENRRTPPRLRNKLRPQIAQVICLPKMKFSSARLPCKRRERPEAWLGQFLMELDLAGVSRRGTLMGASQDAELVSKLRAAREAANQGSPLKFLDDDYAARLRAEDWAAWWSGQDNLAKYCYATLALSLLGDQLVRGRPGHYVPAEHQLAASQGCPLCFDLLCLGKHWPSYVVTDADLERLKAQRVSGVTQTKAPTKIDVGAFVVMATIYWLAW